MYASKKIYWRITLAISILFGLGSILWTYLDGWTVIIKKPISKKYSQEELVTALNDLEEKLRLSRSQRPSKNRYEHVLDGKIYDNLKKESIIKVLSKRPLPQSIEISDFVDEVSTPLVIFGYLLTFLCSFCCPWIAFYIGRDFLQKILDKVSGKRITNK